MAIKQKLVVFLFIHFLPLLDSSIFISDVKLATQNLDLQNKGDSIIVLDIVINVQTYLDVSRSCNSMSQ